MSQGECGSCGRSIDGDDQKFCPQCGQPTPAHRIDWQFLSHEIQHGIFHVDKGILFTVKHLLTRPGDMIREYLDGNRAGHFKPVLLVMILGAAAAIVGRLVRTGESSVSQAWSGLYDGATDAGRISDMSASDARIIEVMKSAFEWISGHVPLVLIMLVPVFALGMRVAFHSYRARATYPEWLVISCFMVAQALLAYIIFAVIGRFLPVLGNLDFLAMMALQAWATVRIFSGRRWYAVMSRFLAGYALYMVMFAALVIALSIAGLVAANGWDAFMEQVRQ